MKYANDVKLPEYYSGLLDIYSSNGINGSNGKLFGAGVFGRDSLQVALDVLEWNPKLAIHVIFSLAQFQGIEYCEKPEEEPGKIPHEIREMYVGGRKIDKKDEEILENLLKNWGKPDWINSKALVYYGSIDATCMYAILISRFCKFFGEGFLDEQFFHRSGKEMSIKDSLEDSIKWIISKIDLETGLLQYKRQNPKGHPFPVMRDGRVAYLHENGILANHNAPLSYLEVQALVYDALYKSTQFLSDRELKNKSDKLLKRIGESLDYFWIEDLEFFAMAIDKDPITGQNRQLRTETSVSGEILDSYILLSLPKEKQRKYIKSIIERLFSPQFLTDAGIRMRSKKHLGLVPYWDYQGVNTTWPVISGRFAKGLRRWGFETLARQIENRFLSAFHISGKSLELYFVDDNGKVLYNPFRILQVENKSSIAAPNKPEDNQAWSISAAINALKSQRELTESEWQSEITKEIISKIKIKELKFSEADMQLLEEACGLCIDTDAGSVAESEFMQMAQAI